MIESIFTSMPAAFRAGTVTAPLSYYFSVEAVKKTVYLTPDACRVVDGKDCDNADCVCKLDGTMLARIWNDGYLPGMKDFLGGAIKSNDPAKLKLFLAAFGRG